MMSPENSLAQEVLGRGLPPPQVVVSQHPQFVQYLRETRMVHPDVPVLARATSFDLDGLHVITSGIPWHLAAWCRTVTLVQVATPKGRRRHELELWEVRRYARPPELYTVERLPY